MEQKKDFCYEINAERYFTQIKLHITRCVGTSAHPEIAMILVSAAKLMIGSVLHTMVCYHSFTLEHDCLTIVIEDNSKYREQNATKVAKHLERVYRVLMSRYGCNCGLKY